MLCKRLFLLYKKCFNIIPMSDYGIGLTYIFLYRRIITMKKLGLFAAGVLFGPAGIKLLSSKDAKKIYARTAAAALRVKDSVMTTVTSVRESAGDIYAEAKAVNESRAKAEAEAVVEDTSAEESKAE